MRGGRWSTTLALLVSLQLLGCLPLRETVQQSDLESTVVVMQTEMATEFAGLKELIATPVIPTGVVDAPTSLPLVLTTVPTGVSGVPSDGVVTTDILNIRTGPSLGHAVSGLLRRDAPLKIKARTESGDWVKVVTDAGLLGWVALEYVDLNIPLDDIPLAVETQNMSTASPTSVVATQTATAATETPASPAEG
jgi:uncharacterized protein YraI